MTITIFTLFVLYTVACCMDGPDLKPKWKKWLGGKLERLANYYYPINYVCKIRYKTRWKTREIPCIPTEALDLVTFDAKKIEQCIILGESELYEARMNDEMMRIRGIPMWQVPGILSEGEIVDRAKKKCVYEILDNVKQFINIEVDRQSRDPDIIVRGHINVGVKRP